MSGTQKRSRPGVIHIHPCGQGRLSTQKGSRLWGLSTLKQSRGHAETVAPLYRPVVTCMSFLPVVVGGTTSVDNLRLPTAVAPLTTTTVRDGAPKTRTGARRL